MVWAWRNCMQIVLNPSDTESNEHGENYVNIIGVDGSLGH